MSFFVCSFFVQAEDGIRDPEMSRGLGDVSMRQASAWLDTQLLVDLIMSIKRVNSMDKSVWPDKIVGVPRGSVSYTHLTLPTNRGVLIWVVAGLVTTRDRRRAHIVDYRSDKTE